MSERIKPCLCVECEVCGAVFMATALSKEYHNDNDSNKDLLNQLVEYAEQGYNVSFKSSNDFSFNLCEHVKAKD